MNKIGKYVQYLRQLNLLSSKILKQQCIIQNHEFSIKSLTLCNSSLGFTTIRYISNSSQIGSSNIVDTNDMLLISIKNAKETSDVLEMLRLHSKVMNVTQYFEALNSLFLLQKSKRTKLSKVELTRSPEFTALCHKLQSHSRNLELNDVLNSVKCLSYLEVPVKSNIMQILLQLISKMINDMNLQQITFLHFILKELSSCPLVDALKLALPIVFETQVHYKLEDNVYRQVEFLSYITKHSLSQESFDFVMSRIINNIDQINPKNVKSLLLCLYHKNYSTDKYIDIINRCLKIVIHRIEFIANITDIEAILSRMIYKYFSGNEAFFNEKFVLKAIEHLIKKGESFEDSGFILKKLNRIGYVHHGLLDYMTDLINNDPNILEKCRFSCFISYIAACANANYVPAGFNELHPIILKRINSQKDILELPWLMMTYDLAVIGCWSEELLEQVFSRSFLYGFLKRSANTLDYIMLLKLYQATMTLYPGGYKGSLPPTEIIEKAIDIYHQSTTDFPLKAALEHGLGGDDYVMSGIISKLGHFIDHLVVMRPGGYPVAIKKEKNCDQTKILLEHFLKSNDNVVIAILVHKMNNYTHNSNCLRGPHMFMNKTIEALGAVTLSISLNVWDGLIDYEKIPFIMRELKSKSDLNFIAEKNVAH